MQVDITAPETFGARIIDDLHSRRGEIAGGDVRDGEVIIDATVPLVNAPGLAAAMSAMTDRQATVTIAFAHDAPVRPPEDSPFQPAVRRAVHSNESLFHRPYHDRCRSCERFHRSPSPPRIRLGSHRSGGAHSAL